MLDIGKYVILLMMAFTVIYAAIHGINIYSAFIEGIKKGIESVWGIFPTLFALFISVAALRASGFIDFLTNIIKPFTDFIHFPSELVGFALLRPVSGSGSLAVAADIFSACGADSFVGRAASVMMGSSETTFYTVSVYFAATGIKNIRYTLKCALIADLISTTVSIIVCAFYFG